MTAEQLRRVHRAEPFCPYKLLLTDGTFHIIDLLLVAAIEVGNGSPSRRGNGRKKKT
ncbi:MAG: hypothetical protein V3W34_12755 [Phycisphaerae bacterium]